MPKCLIEGIENPLKWTEYKDLNAFFYFFCDRHGSLLSFGELQTVFRKLYYSRIFFVKTKVSLQTLVMTSALPEGISFTI